MRQFFSGLQRVEGVGTRTLEAENKERLLQVAQRDPSVIERLDESGGLDTPRRSDGVRSTSFPVAYSVQLAKWDLGSV